MVFYLSFFNFQWRLVVLLRATEQARQPRSQGPLSYSEKGPWLRLGWVVKCKIVAVAGKTQIVLEDFEV